MRKRSAASSEHPRGNAHLETCSALSFPRDWILKALSSGSFRCCPPARKGSAPLSSELQPWGLKLQKESQCLISEGWQGPAVIWELQFLAQGGCFQWSCWSHQTAVETKARLLWRGLVKEVPSMDRDTQKKAGKSDRWVVNTILPSKGSCIRWALLHVGLTNPSV